MKYVWLAVIRCADVLWLRILKKLVDFVQMLLSREVTNTNIGGHCSQVWSYISY